MNHPTSASDGLTYPFSARAVVAFYVLTYLFSWSVWASVIADQNGVLSFHLPEGVALWSLLLATVVAAGVTGGVPALRDLGARLVRWRVAPTWYAVALLLPPVLAFLPAGVYRAAGGAVPVGADMSLGAALGYLAFGIVLFSLTEESAWRGFALPRLLARFNALVSALVIGGLWGLWHVPLWFISDAPQGDWPYAGFWVLTVAESVIITWVFVNARGSVLLAGLFHASSDAALAYSGVLSGGGGLFWVTVGTFLLAAAVIVARCGTSLLVPRHESRRAPAGRASTSSS